MPSNPHDSPSANELKWASLIKAAAHNDPSFPSADSISDLEFLHHTIYGLNVLDNKENEPLHTNVVTPALERLRNLQAFKERFGILNDGSVEEAARDFKTFVTLHPGFWQSIAQVEEGDNAYLSSGNSGDTPPFVPHVFCVDLAAALGTKMNSNEAFAVSLRAFFYIMQSMLLCGRVCALLAMHEVWDGSISV